MTQRPFLLTAREERLRAPLLVVLWALFTVEALGGLVIFAARVAVGRRPGESLHVAAGLGLIAVYAIYQWRHWNRVKPVRARLDHGLGLLAAGSMLSVNVTGVVLGLAWWRQLRGPGAAGGPDYPAFVSGLHNIAGMLVLTFVAAHVGSVLLRDRRTDSPRREGPGEDR